MNARELAEKFLGRYYINAYAGDLIKDVTEALEQYGKFERLRAIDDCIKLFQEHPNKNCPQNYGGHHCLRCDCDFYSHWVNLRALKDEVKV